MRIAFYAPMKPPDHPVASGDRTVARGLIAALRLAGHEVTIPSRLRTHDRGDPERQARLRDLGGGTVKRLLRRFEREGAPELWFTYHLYHKAPDWLGPAISARLDIPYVVAEASFAPKQASGRWILGHRAAAEALAQAARVFQLNPADDACVRPLLRTAAALVRLPPFLDTTPWRAPDRPRSRAAMAQMLELGADAPWILTVAMMREDQKLLSYLCLAEALLRLTDLPWSLVIAGTGPSEAEIRRAFAPLAGRVRWVGLLDRGTLAELYRAADLFAWPAIKEAWGMALLEAQAAGLPVVAGNSGGVASVVAHGETGLLASENDVPAFAEALRTLLRNPGLRTGMGLAAEARAASEHDLAGAATLLDRTLAAVIAECQR
jgi:glycosyltransferase involved in cell wall biosynthesis